MIRIITNPEQGEWERLSRRAEQDDPAIESRVAAILESVCRDGDDALYRLSREIDGVELDGLKVAPEEIARAREEVSPQIRDAIAVAKRNIEVFHRAQLQSNLEVDIMPGIRCSQRSKPIERIGLYIPGGSAPLFSTVLMVAIPARVAGCSEIILSTPAPVHRGGTVAAEILYAASECGITDIYKLGGAQAIAAMAYGTQTIKCVDKIFGPGNRYVTKAKLLVSRDRVAIDMPAGPSEVLILADESSVPEFVAADLLSQAEHGADSQTIMITSSRALAERVNIAIRQQLAVLSRKDIAIRALENSAIIVMDSIDDMIAFANLYAAEHLIIAMNEPWDVAERITAAGSVFIGNYSPESAGDYASGTNHTLPTAGWARSVSGLNLDAFMRRITYQELTREGLESLGNTIITMAEAEGLDAHANAVNRHGRDSQRGAGTQKEDKHRVFL